jgi:hypothetical protein
MRFRFICVLFARADVQPCPSGQNVQYQPRQVSPAILSSHTFCQQSHPRRPNKRLPRPPSLPSLLLRFLLPLKLSRLPRLSYFLPNLPFASSLLYPYRSLFLYYPFLQSSLSTTTTTTTSTTTSSRSCSQTTDVLPFSTSSRRYLPLSSFLNGVIDQLDQLNRFFRNANSPFSRSFLSHSLRSINPLRQTTSWRSSSSCSCPACHERSHLSPFPAPSKSRRQRSRSPSRPSPSCCYGPVHASADARSPDWRSTKPYRPLAAS